MTNVISAQTYRGTLTGEANQPAAIARAYRLAGIEPPTYATAVADALSNEPKPDAVAADLARAALELTGPDAAKFVRTALDRLARANGIEQLRTALARASARALRDAMPGMLARAVDDLTPAFNATAERLAQAARVLPADAPLDVAAVAAIHATRELEAAHEALRELSTYAAVFQTAGTWGLDGNGADLTAILPVVTVPPCTVELVAPGQPHDGALNPDELTTTRTVRQLAEDVARHGDDHVLVSVARGSYPGVAIVLAGRSGDTITDRRDRITAAHARRRADRPARTRVTVTTA